MKKLYTRQRGYCSDLESDLPPFEELMTTRYEFVIQKVFTTLLLVAMVTLPGTTPGHSYDESQIYQAAPLKAAPVSRPFQFMNYSSSFSTDRTHEYIEQNILKQVVRFDDFFGISRSESTRKAGYLLRWKNSVRLGDDGKPRVATSIRANIQLSAINEKLRLSLSGDDLPERKSQNLPDDPGAPSQDRTIQPTRLVNTELRYIINQTTAIDSFIGAGVRLNFPVKTFVRGRYVYTYPLSDVSLVRLGETLFLTNRDGFGETTEISIERLLDSKTVLKWASSGTISESISGLEWGSHLSLIRELSSRSAVSVTGGVYGDTNSAAIASNFRLSTNYRRNFHREWLFYEVEPEIFWPRDATGSYSANYAIFLRLEVLFEERTPSTAGK